jgi:hypothetical protein
MLLLSPAIGIVVGGKPDRPGKPEPPSPETATFRMSIGVEGEHVVLMEPEYFDVVTSVEGWYLKEKGKTRQGSWGIPVGEDRYGSYTMQNVYSVENDTYMTDFYDGELAQLVGFEHHLNLKQDYWRIGISWTTDLDGNGELDPLILAGETDRGPEREGSFDSENDVWTVTFTTTNAYFVVGWCDGSTCWTYWCGYLEFTITIQRIE